MQTCYGQYTIPDRLFNLTSVDDEINVMKLIASTLEHPHCQMQAAEKILEAKQTTSDVEDVVTAMINSIPRAPEAE